MGSALSFLEVKRILGLFVYQQEKSCPLCGSSHVHRTKRSRVFEFWILLVMPYRPYRCGKCRQRFYGPKKHPPSVDPDEISQVQVENTSAPMRTFQESSRR
jgi:ribosomal protein L37AE/L43A